MWQSLLIELGFYFVKKYINSSETKKDDKVLKLVQEGARYIVDNKDNDISLSTVLEVKSI